MSKLLLIDVLNNPKILLKVDDKHSYQVITEARHLSLLGQLRARCYQAQIEQDLPLHTQQQLMSGFHSYQKQQQQLLLEHQHLTEQLQGIIGSWRYLRGSALQWLDNDMFAGRVKRNIDIYVPPQHVVNVEKALLNNGWRYKNIADYEETFYRRWAQQTTPLIHKQRRTELAIHFQLLPKTLSNKLNSGPLLHHHLSPVACEPATLLSPDAMVLHQAIMLFNQIDYQYGLRDIYSLYLQFIYFSQQPTFWHNLIQLQQQVGNDNSLYLAVSLCRDLFNLSVPEQALTYFKQQKSHRISYWIYKQRFIDAFVYRFPLHRNAEYRDAVKSLRFRGRLKQMPIYCIVPHIIKRLIINSIPHDDEEVIY
ncbi:nucleotidyltransferase family protein [Photobacterium aquimaris]|uniref:Nucleotidyltransferase family protein n=1 Tax=Photobacterium aquimaris TaxID=512643 RepID=A0A2T3HXE8_9GAMM|nr:nucleotidyltransferase family protein [Photobacterium aquimaris]MCP4954524.1 nucleotidyltransferase family protein [Photobacterium aquimaris]OBU24666.1 hypothetical protein AYY21_11240 [Photobacterium aquimaris]PQJ38481.1 hypothetical protein BTN98_13790 [Photobacterium aquimaris]PSU03782.1 hypothetical protein C0W81_11310 [Photobacterium aquimaris]